MKLFFKLAQLMIIINLLFASCTPPVPPVPPTRDLFPNGETSTSFPVSLARVVNPPSSATQIEFLVDNSGSVVGSESSQKGCKKTNNDVRTNFIGYIHEVLNNSIAPQDFNFLSLGVGIFGDRYTPLDWSFLKIPDPDNNTNYTIGIQGALDHMYTDSPSPSARRYLVILTDGAFTSESVESVDAKLRGIEGISIYVVLLCSKELSLTADVNSWVDRIGKLKNVEVFLNMEDAIKRIFDNLKSQGFLPQDSQNIVVPDQNNMNVPGYATSVVFSYWSSEVNDNLNIKDTLTNAQETYAIGDHTFSPKPIPGCLDNDLVINHTGISKGFLLVKPLTFQNLQLSFGPSQVNELEVVNYSADIQMDIYDNRPDQDLGMRRDCFSINLLTQNGDLLDTSPLCDNGAGNICSNNDNDKKLHGELRWKPAPGTGQQLAKIKVRFGTSSSDVLWESNIDVSYKFQPAFRSISDTTTFDLTEPINGYFNFRNVADQPSIYFLSDLNELDFDEAGKNLLGKTDKTWALCPSWTNIINKQLASQIRLSSISPSCQASVDTEILTDACAIKAAQYQYRYDVATYWYSVQECGYKTVLFVWDASKDTKSIAWQCGLSSKLCEPIPIPLIELRLMH